MKYAKIVFLTKKTSKWPRFQHVRDTLIKVQTISYPRYSIRGVEASNPLEKVGATIKQIYKHAWVMVLDPQKRLTIPE